MRKSEPEVFVCCAHCGTGAIYVSEVGPMGDEFHETVEEAVASGQHWSSLPYGFVCPTCTSLDLQVRGAGLAEGVFV